MIYLWPQASSMADFVPNFGVITSPAHETIPLGILEGRWWACDNEAFSREFEPDRFFRHVEKLKPFREKCLFLTVPDVVGDVEKTLDLFDKWRPFFDGWPVAFVAQDGQEKLPWPGGSLPDITDWLPTQVTQADYDEFDDIPEWKYQELVTEYNRLDTLPSFDWVFIGGSTDWKMGPGGRACILSARSRGKLVHVGRVNSIRRFRYFQRLGVDTVDGTTARFNPREAQRKLSRAVSQHDFNRTLLDGDSNSKPIDG